MEYTCLNVRGERIQQYWDTYIPKKLELVKLPLNASKVINTLISMYPYDKLIIRELINPTTNVTLGSITINKIFIPYIEWCVANSDSSDGVYWWVGSNDVTFPKLDDVYIIQDKLTEDFLKARYIIDIHRITLATNNLVRQDEYIKMISWMTDKAKWTHYFKYPNETKLITAPVIKNVIVEAME